MHTHTHTYVTLDVSAAAFEEIKKKLLAAGYDHVFDNNGKTIDMAGIALEQEDSNG
jgi:hypothetical protein